MRRELWVLAFALALPSAIAYVYFIALSSPASADGHANPYLQTAYSAGKVILFGLPIAWLAFADRTALRLRRPSWRGVPFGIVFGLAVAVLALTLYTSVLAHGPMFRDLPVRLRSKVTEFGAATPGSYVALAVFLSVAHSLLEEYYWRWFVFGRLRRYVPLTVALTVSGLAFASHHVIVLYVYFPDWFWSAVLPFSLGIAVGGAVWAWLYERSGSLLGPWLSHLIVDAALMTIGYDLLFRVPALGG